jgi:hypothetical protein
MRNRVEMRSYVPSFVDKIREVLIVFFFFDKVLIVLLM